MHGKPSRYDDNFYYWPSTDNNGMQSLDAAVTVHVDDLVVTATKQWLSKTYDRFLAKFGKVKRCALPSTNVGMEYSRLPGGGVLLAQVKCVEALKFILFELLVHDSWIH